MANWKVAVVAMAVTMGGMAGDARAQLIVAHRGASHDAPENTIAAFELAWEQEADGVEGDFRLTSDGEIVCIHDADTKRVSGVRRVIADTPLDQLRQMDVGSWKGDQWQGEGIPTFAEVLRVIPKDKWFFIELKTGPEIVAPLVEQLRDYRGDRDKLVIITFNAETLARCNELLPDIKAHWLTGFKQDKETGAWHPDARTVAETVRINGAEGVGMRGLREVVDPTFINRMRSAGLSEFHVWTIDDPSTALFFQSQGPLGITTNRPAEIRRALESGS